MHTRSDATMRTRTTRPRLQRVRLDDEVARTASVRRHQIDNHRTAGCRGCCAIAAGHFAAHPLLGCGGCVAAATAAAAARGSFINYAILHQTPATHSSELVCIHTHILYGNTVLIIIYYLQTKRRTRGLAISLWFMCVRSVHVRMCALVRSSSIAQVVMGTRRREVRANCNICLGVSSWTVHS